jgi:cyclopropane fatty-acyl-phospholipid synthase-like methyltransferase
MPDALPYRDFYYPLNVLLHVLTAEEGSVEYLHYGVFDRPDERIAAAQERSTAMLFERLPKPPARVLDVGIGLGTTLSRLTRAGYETIGITPDAKQVAAVHTRFGDSVDARTVAFEAFDDGKFDVVVFQESSQYIVSDALFAKAAHITNDIVLLDEFALEPEGDLHRYDEFMAAADRHGFKVRENVDLTERAAPTIDYFRERLPRFRTRLIADLGITDAQVTELIESGERYADLYRRKAYVYRLMTFQAMSSRA